MRTLPVAGKRVSLPGWLLGGLLTAALLPSNSAAASKVTVVLSRTLAPYQLALQGFQSQGDFAVQTLNLEGDTAKARSLPETVSMNGSDLVLAMGTEALTSVRENWPGCPVVYSMVLEEYDSPNRRVGGVLLQIPLEDQLARLAMIVPGAKKVGVIYNPAFSKKSIAQARELVGNYGLTLIPAAVEKPEEIPAALANLAGAEVNVLWTVLDPTVARPETAAQMIRFTLDHRLPFIALAAYHVKAGALATFSVDYTDIGAQTAALARRMAEKSDWHGRVERPRKIVIYYNPQTQKQLGLDGLPKLPEARLVE